MEKVTRFEELEVFQKARAICKEIYRITDENPFKSDYRFVQQIRAAGGSIMDNIAEGFERNGNKEFANFLFIAKGWISFDFFSPWHNWSELHSSHLA